MKSEDKNNASIIAISGKSGCGNSTVSGLVANKLERRLVNYTFRSMAKEMDIPFEEFIEMAQNDKKWDQLLDKKQVMMAHEEDCVIASRLAIWVVTDACLKVYLHASNDIRAKRIHKREGGSLDEIRLSTSRRDLSDHERYKVIYGIDNDAYDFADIIINTDNMTPERISNIIIAALK